MSERASGQRPGGADRAGSSHREGVGVRRGCWRIFHQVGARLLCYIKLMT